MENDEAGAVWLETRRKKWAISCDLFRFLSAISPTIASFLIDLPPPVNAYKKPRCLQKELAKKIAEIMKLYKVEITCLEKNLRPITREWHVAPTDLNGSPQLGTELKNVNNSFAGSSMKKWISCSIAISCLSFLIAETLE
jgi:hypothetical protein